MHSKEFPWAQYKPKDGILVVQPVWITEREIQFLMQLYAPFIGKEATLLYATLYGELSPSEYESEVFSISELLSMTNLGMPDFYLAKTRLEGIGLLENVS
jgi:DNA replication protein dnaB